MSTEIENALGAMGFEITSGEVAEDIRERPSAEDLPVAPDGELVRYVGEAAGWDGGWRWGA